MLIEQIYTGCLAQGAYYIESEGQAAVIDPLREPSPYLDKAEKNKASIKYIFETHFHADFVSGHLDLAKKTGAEIVFGPLAETSYDSYSAEDGEVFEIGNVKIKALHTPGHTPESTTYLLIDENGKNHAIFSGDTLFIGDVGRPDLAVKSNLSKEDLAGMLYDSLHNKILPLEDEVLVYPAHGAGSACGKKMSKETFDYLGTQKKSNYALLAPDKNEFIKQVIEGIMPPPPYFPANVKMNKEGYDSFDDVMKKGRLPLSPENFEELVNSVSALMLDTRNQQVFNKAFIPNSVNISLDGQFAPWVGTLIPDINQAIVIIAEEDKIEETLTRLARVGYENVLGYLDGGIEQWKKSNREIDTIKSVSSEDLKNMLNSGDKLNILDVRRPSEFEISHLPDAVNYPLDFINDWFAELNKDTDYVLHCSGGYRSMTTASILRSRGFDKIVDVDGGFNAIAEAGIKLITNN
ncbi:MAG: MBL fold metallo-hydrolase [Candidatus Kapabacteria bacterium]|jgi:glyoxylase-like metal-dependent hydrolase (beta-lactamase superfamily II)/rhodanese-related sulfurtransferase|nr:MBL fold metallo-hydrolase [Candidatus Kapabacteria bacterium]